MHEVIFLQLVDVQPGKLKKKGLAPKSVIIELFIIKQADS